MISFPNAKINIGLNVLEKRPDGYHNIESIFYPIALRDALETTESDAYGSIDLSVFGNVIPGSKDTNLCVKAYHLLNSEFKLPSINLGLLKHIPMGAGLGGGSADAAFFIKMLNESFDLKLSVEELKVYASQIGSDCPFFIDNTPSFISGKGEIITPIQLDLSNYHTSIIYPQIHVDTKNAYSLITPHKQSRSLNDIISNTPIQSWRKTIFNDFEEPIFKLYPQLAEIKNCLYNSGALYASMTGSGSALYSIFEKKPYLAEVLPNCKIWTIPPKYSI